MYCFYLSKSISMKNLFLFIILFLLNGSIVFSQIAINTDGSQPASSAMLDVKSTTKGFLPPRMAHSELNAIPAPADGLIVYCTDCGSNGSGALSMFITGSWYILSANCMGPASPAGGTHVASVTQVIWNWNQVPGATGYKWNTTNDISTALNLTPTSYTETGLGCNTSYSRYVWAVNTCGVSTAANLSQSTAACLVLPTVSTASISGITQTTAAGGGNVTSDGGATVTSRGVCWSTSPNPVIAGSHTTDGSGTGLFLSTLAGLTPSTPYYLRAYATNSVGTSYGNEVGFTTSAPAFTIGQSYGGGIIFYIDGSGQHGLIAAQADQSTNATWANYGYFIPGTSIAFGTGQANTNAIVAGCGTPGIAARICDDLILNGYSDWFLPSKDELDQMYVHREIIGGFAGEPYWSSSGQDAVSSWIIRFDIFHAIYLYNVGGPGYVRAARAF